MKNSSINIEMYVKWLNELATSENIEVAEDIGRKFEETAFSEEKIVDSSVERIIPVAIDLIPKSTSHGRAIIFEILYPFGAGYSFFDEDVYWAKKELEHNCRKEVVKGSEIYLAYLKNITDEEKLTLPSLIELCGRDNLEYAKRSMNLLTEILEITSNEQQSRVFKIAINGINDSVNKLLK